MAKGDYIPRNDVKFLRHHDRLKEAAENLATTFSLSQADLAAIGEDNANLHDRMDSVDAHAASAQQATKEKDDVRQLVEQHVRALARQLKAHKNYTEGLGEALGIVGAEQGNGGSAPVQPRATAKALPHSVVEVRFNKNSHEGVNVYSENLASGTLSLLARATYSPYMDNRPAEVAGKPEVRRYRAIYVDDDVETGELSEATIVTTQSE